MRDDNAYLFAGLAAFAALAASIGDFLMLSVAFGALGASEMPSERLVLAIGGALGALFIPLYVLGYAASTRLVQQSKTRLQKALVLSGVAVAASSALAHLFTAFEVDLLLRSRRYINAPIEILYVSTSTLSLLATLSAASMTTASMIFAWATWRERVGVANLRPWHFNPVIVVLALVAISSHSTFLSAYAAPAAPNLAHLVFFLVCGYTITAHWRRSKTG